MRSDKYDKEQDIKEENNIEEQEKPHKLLKIIKKISISLILIILLFFTYTRFIEPSIIINKEYKIESSLLPDSFNGVKIIHLSDIHYGTTFSKKNLTKLIDNINKQKPDIIFFTGDLIDKSINLNEEEQNEIIELLSNLNATIGKYTIIGDDDTEKVFNNIFEKSNFTILNNESSLLFYKDSIPIQITGFNTDREIDYSIIDINNEEYPDIYKIVLIHNPKNIDKILNYNPALILSGHTLGGSIRIPKLKPLFIDKDIKYYKDYDHINNTDIYISNGLGTNDIPLRFNNLPSYNLYRLYKIF